MQVWVPLLTTHWSKKQQNTKKKCGPSTPWLLDTQLPRVLIALIAHQLPLPKPSKQVNVKSW